MARMTCKMWIGVGAASVASLVSGAATSALAQHGGHGAAAPKAPTSGPANTPPTKGEIAAPQGGETYLTDGGPADTRIRIYRDIALMRGHLMVGDELVQQGRWDDALPHFLHPTEELYVSMNRYIKLHSITPFDGQLKQLAQAVKAKNKAAYAQSAKIVEQRIQAALNGFRRFMTVQPFSSYTARTLAEVAKVAQSEYEAAVEDGKFGKPVEYQDSRGFIWHAEQLINRHAAEFQKVDAAGLAKMRQALADLKPAWPGAVPPATPVIAPAALSEKIDAFVKSTEVFN